MDAVCEVRLLAVAEDGADSAGWRFHLAIAAPEVGALQTERASIAACPSPLPGCMQV